jgi:hypothetical protein
MVTAVRLREKYKKLKILLSEMGREITEDK